MAPKAISGNMQNDYKKNQGNKGYYKCFNPPGRAGDRTPAGLCIVFGINIGTLVRHLRPLYTYGFQGEPDNETLSDSMSIVKYIVY